MKKGKSFKAEQIITEKKKTDKGDTETTSFNLVFDPETGASTKILISSYKEQNEGSGGNKGSYVHVCRYGVPEELLTTNDPALADKVAKQYTNMIAENTLFGTKRGGVANIDVAGDFKWKDLTNQKMKEAFQVHAEAFQKKGIKVFVNGEEIKPKPKQDKHPLDELGVVPGNTALFSRGQKPKPETTSNQPEHKPSPLAKKLLDSVKNPFKKKYKREE